MRSCQRKKQRKEGREERKKKGKEEREGRRQGKREGGKKNKKREKEREYKVKNSWDLEFFYTFSLVIDTNTIALQLPLRFTTVIKCTGLHTRNFR
jgi:hypothetical protein